MKTITFFSELSVFSQIVIYNRLVNYHVENGTDYETALTNADETMNEKISLFYGDEMTPDTIECADIIAEDEHGRYFDTTDLDNVLSEGRARDIAIEWSNQQGRYNLSWGELAEIQDYFEELATRFPNLREEFEENAIL